MAAKLVTGKPQFGTAPVFLTGIATILGAVMFLRFGYAVGNVGLLGALLIIAIGHMVTLPTAMAIAEIATNQKVQGGGEYYIISRSFGIIIGASIGIALFLSQAISVAFYVIAFAEAFDPIFQWMGAEWGLLPDKRWVSLPAMLGLTALILGKGADLGVKALYFVVGILFLSLAMFFLGQTGYGAGDLGALVARAENPDPLFRVFAIVFPAFTGMTAGVGLSGDLRDPKRSIPLGTLAATLTAMVVYVLIAYKLAVSAAPEDLATDQLIMSKIALWGPIIPIGLAAATISSAIGSFLVAPRTLQAIATDRVLPWRGVYEWLSRGKGTTNEPLNASCVTAAIAVAFVVLGDVDFVAQIISMFFMVTYGSLCLISFLEHFAADPSYRPAFRSRWYLSLFGAALCLLLMFQMSTVYAVVAIVVMFLLYTTISRYNPDKGGLSNIVQSAIFQMSRQLHVFLQKSRKDEGRWRPSVVCISSASFRRLAAFDLLRWIAHRYGFGTYIHFVQGYLSRATHEDSKQAMQRLVAIAHTSRSNVVVDTIVSPSYTTAICQVMQLPGVSGQENNMVLFEFAKGNSEELEDIVDNYQLVASVGFDVCILASSTRGFGYRKEIHVWLTPRDYENASLMIVVAYILLGHPDWKKAVIKIFSILPAAEMEQEKESLHHLIRAGRLPIAAINVELIPQDPSRERQSIINERSRDADIVILGFRGDTLRHARAAVFHGFEDVGNLLFVNTRREIELAPEEGEETPAEPAPTSETRPEAGASTKSPAGAEAAAEASLSKPESEIEKAPGEKE